jgi:polyhydroxyalkanoate synthesis repressor PhaR
MVQRSTVGAHQGEWVLQKQKATAASGSSATSHVRTIKKYPNRRLYDTDSSSYVTLAEVKQLVMNALPFVVVDAKTGDDLTRSILLQIILEEETGGVPMFSEAVLANIIRFYGHAMQGFMGNYLEHNVQAFSDMQAKLSEQAKGFTPDAWAQMMGMAKPSDTARADAKNPWQQMQEQMQKQTEQMLSAFGVKR